MRQFRSNNIFNDDELVCEDTGSYIIKVFTKQHTNYSNSNPLQVIECEKYEVIPETVGQFTGLCDKNGRKIFEGDIVESPNGTQGFIEWQNAECAFLVDIGDDWQTMDDCPYEVIGNKYDNKEEE